MPEPSSSVDLLIIILHYSIFHLILFLFSFSVFRFQVIHPYRFSAYRFHYSKTNFWNIIADLSNIRKPPFFFQGWFRFVFLQNSFFLSYFVTSKNSVWMRFLSFGINFSFLNRTPWQLIIKSFLLLVSCERIYSEPVEIFFFFCEQFFALWTDRFSSGRHGSKVDWRNVYAI